MSRHPKVSLESEDLLARLREEAPAHGYRESEVGKFIGFVFREFKRLKAASLTTELLDDYLEGARILTPENVAKVVNKVITAREQHLLDQMDARIRQILREEFGDD